MMPKVTRADREILDDEDRRQDALALEVEAEMDEVANLRPSKRKIRVRRGGPSHQFSIRFAPEEIDALQAAADERDVTITEFIRGVALEKANRPALGADSVPEVSNPFSKVDELMEALRASVEAARLLAGIPEESLLRPAARRTTR